MRMAMLLALAGTALCVERARAQFSPPISSTFVVSPTIAYTGLNLNGPTIPVGVYGSCTLATDWVNDPENTDVFQSDQRFALHSSNLAGAIPPNGPLPAYAGGEFGEIPTTDFDFPGSGTVTWVDRPFTNYFVANSVSPLWLGIRANYVGPLNDGGTWTNIQLTLHAGIADAPAPSNDDCATPIVIPGNVTSFLTPGVDVSGATAQLQDRTACAFDVDHSIWYSFTPTQTGDYKISTCDTDAPQNTVSDTVLGVFVGSCGALSQVTCNDDANLNCGDFFRRSVTIIRLNAGTTYRIMAGRYAEARVIGDTTRTMQVAITNFRLPPGDVACRDGTETEPNDLPTSANALSSVVGNSICGTSTGASLVTPGIGSADFFKFTTAPHAGIVRHGATLTTLNATVPRLGLVGIDPAPGAPSDLIVAIQLGRAVGNTRVVEWYTLGGGASPDERSIYARVAGFGQSASNYNVAMTSSTPIVPATISRTVRPGSITISTVGETGPTQTDTDLWVYDSNFAAIANFGNDDEPGVGTTLGSRFTRTFAPGTYYLAVGTFQMSLNQLTPPDDNVTNETLTDFPGVLVASSELTNDRSFRITDSEGSVITPAAATEPFEVLFYQLVVQEGSALVRCNPADIAYDDGSPLPPLGVPGGVNNGVTEGDYNLFFANFFD
ncbi:MAG: hypothetical protein K2X32_07475, partial [Phycisphaerales bacterium]|nr:hypothetical protein [Phycisphaerales bacterium]